MDSILPTSSVFRRLQWRSDRALELVEHRPTPLRPTSADDPVLRRYCSLLLELRNAADDEEMLEAVAAKFPSIAMAHDLYYSPQSFDRQVLEARILARETSEAIAAKMATKETAVLVYENLFFDVRPHLQNSTYVRKVAIERSFGRGLAQMTADELRGRWYRTVAYYGGPKALDAIIPGGNFEKKPKKAEELAAWLLASTNSALTTRAATAALGLRVNSNDAMRLIKLALDSPPPIKDQARELEEARWKEIWEAVQRGPLGQATAHRDRPSAPL